MSRPIGFLWACAALVGASAILGNGANAQDALGSLVPAHVAERHGLRRAWVAQAEVDRGADQLSYISLWPGVPAKNGERGHDMLLLQTAKGAVHALDAETGETLWVERVGKSTLVTTAAAANDWCVVVCNGPKMYVLNRTNGALMWDRTLIGGFPSAGTSISEVHAYVPMFNGSVVSYVLKAMQRKISKDGKVEESIEKGDATDDAAAENGGNEKSSKRASRPSIATTPEQETIITFTPSRTPPQRYMGTSPATGPPVVTRGGLAWGTTSGDVYSTSIGTMTANFRFRTSKRIAAPLSGMGNYVIAASRDGDVFAIHANMGSPAWQFTTGRAIHHQPVVVGDAVYVLPERGGMYRVDLIKGREMWHAHRAAQFLSASASRVYALDANRSLLVLNSTSGAPVDAMPLPKVDLTVTNNRHDRIFLATHSGLVQCLRETALESPTLHTTPGDVAPGSDVRAERKSRDAAAKAAEEGGVPAAQNDEEESDDSAEEEEEEEESADDAKSADAEEEATE